MLHARAACILPSWPDTETVNRISLTQRVARGQREARSSWVDGISRRSFREATVGRTSGAPELGLSQSNAGQPGTAILRMVGLTADLQAGMAVTTILFNPLIFISLIYTELKIEGRIERRGCGAADLPLWVIKFPAMLLRKSKSFFSLAARPLDWRIRPVASKHLDAVDASRCAGNEMGGTRGDREVRIATSKKRESLRIRGKSRGA